jgi:hypothetical protein
VLLGNLLLRPVKKKSSLLGNWFMKWKCTNIVIQYSFYLREWVGEKRGREEGRRDWSAVLIIITVVYS